MTRTGTKSFHQKIFSSDFCESSMFNLSHKQEIKATDKVFIFENVLQFRLDFKMGTIRY